MRFFHVILIAATLAVSAAGQDRASVTSQPNTVVVTAEGKFEAAPDTAVAQFNISAQDNTAKGAYDRAARAQEQVRALLRSNGVDPKQAQFGYLSVEPVYDYRKPDRKIIAYRVNSSVTLKLKDFAKVGGIVEQLGNLDVTANQTLSYALENTDDAKLKAIEDAMQRARTEAGALAKSGSRNLGEMIYASVDTQEMAPVPMMNRGVMAMNKEAAPTAEFTPQTITVTARATAVFALR